MDSSARKYLEGWLRYADDLRLGPFYLDRTPRTLPGVSGAPIGPSLVQEPFVSPKTETPPESPVAVPYSVPSTASASSGFAGAPPLVRPGGRRVGTPISISSSLFEERIENDSLEEIRTDIGPDCSRCKLHRSRTQIVFGVGNPKAELVFVGEGPGRDEDVQGEPFVGRAGKLLTQMIEAMSLRREDVYICNVVKCRPPENRLPERDEIAACSPYLVRQLAVIQPKVICCLGACAAQTLLNTNQGISRFRGEWFDYRGAKLIATYHPAYLLRNPNAKPEVWKDLQTVMAVLGLQPKRR